MLTRDMKRKYVGERAGCMFVPVAAPADAGDAPFRAGNTGKANLD
jgi:hypothetical protein